MPSKIGSGRFFRASAASPGAQAVKGKIRRLHSLVCSTRGTVGGRCVGPQPSVLGTTPESHVLNSVERLCRSRTDLEPRPKKDCGRMREFGSACRGTVVRSRMEGLRRGRAGWLWLAGPSRTSSSTACLLGPRSEVWSASNAQTSRLSGRELPKPRGERGQVRAGLFETYRRRRWAGLS